MFRLCVRAYVILYSVYVFWHCRHLLLSTLPLQHSALFDISNLYVVWHYSSLRLLTLQLFTSIDISALCVFDDLTLYVFWQCSSLHIWYCSSFPLSTLQHSVHLIRASRLWYYSTLHLLTLQLTTTFDIEAHYIYCHCISLNLLILQLSIPSDIAALYIGWWWWSGVAKVSCVLRHWGVQLILSYSWARPVIFVAGKSRGDAFISYVSSLSFLFLFLPFPSRSSHLLSLLFYLFSGRRHKMTKGWRVFKPQHNQRINISVDFAAFTIFWHYSFTSFHITALYIFKLCSLLHSLTLQLTSSIDLQLSTSYDIAAHYIFWHCSSLYHLILQLFTSFNVAVLCVIWYFMSVHLWTVQLSTSFDDAAIYLFERCSTAYLDISIFWYFRSLRPLIASLCIFRHSSSLHLLHYSSLYTLLPSTSYYIASLYLSNVAPSTRKHACIILTPLNPTFIL